MKPMSFTDTASPLRPNLQDFGPPVSVRSPTGEPIQPDHLAQIEQLDDVVFAALDGDPNALDQSARVFRELSRQAPADLVEESREHYLRRAESIVEQYQQDPGNALAQTFAALEILTLVAE